MPLTVYLDTQDYIKLFNEPDDGPNHQVLADLLSYRDRGEILIGFSFVTIIEFITKPDAPNRPERVRRGQLIKDVCGPNAFPYITDLARGATFPNGGKWMFSNDEKIVSAKKFRLQMHKILAEELEKTENLNRTQKRQLRRKASMGELLRRSDSSWGRKRSDYGGYPVSDEIIESRILERFVKGQCTDAEFERRLNAWISDPSEFSRIAYDYADKPNMIEAIFGKSTDDIERQIISLQDETDSVRHANEELLKARANLIEAGVEKSKARQLTKKVSLPEPNLDMLISKLEVTIGEGRAGHFKHYFTRLMKPGYNFKRSDVMDLMQMCYAYDCDLFRCDKAMNNTFLGFAPFEGKLVGRFAELPTRVEALLVR